jgi:hypothetical protein
MESLWKVRFGKWNEKNKMNHIWCNILVSDDWKNICIAKAMEIFF